MAETKVLTVDNQKSSFLDGQVFKKSPFLSIEVLLFILIVLAAIISRLYNLGDRVMSHDESLHTYFSWLLYKGSGFEHNPMMHGPLQFHLLAVTYFLLGTTDFTARLPHAISSIFTIILLWKWRRYLGRSGTLIAACLALISPYLLYYGRYARNEAFVGLLGILTLYAILRYLETGKPRYLYLLTIGSVLHFTVKETAFIYTAQILLFLLYFFISQVTKKTWGGSKSLRSAFIVAIAAGVLLLGIGIGLAISGRNNYLPSTLETAPPQVPGQVLTYSSVQNQLTLPLIMIITALLVFLAAGILLIFGLGWKAIRAERSFDLLMLLGTLVLPLLVAFPVKLIGKLVDPVNGWNPLDYSFMPSISLSEAMKTGVINEYFADFFNQGVVHTGIVLIPVLLLSLLFGLWWNKKLWLLNAAIWYVLFTFFFTTFFTNGQGFFTGMVGSLGYWLEQQGVNRGSQPWYYYLAIQIPLYEYLPALGLWLTLYLVLKNKFHPPLPSPTSSEKILSSAQDSQEAYNSNHSLPLLLWWMISSAIAYTIAGEKMPWLTYHITLPLILITGWSLGQIIEQMNWKEFWKKKGVLMIGLIIVLGTSLGALFVNLFGSNPPFQGKDLVQLSATTSFLFSFLAICGSISGIVYIIFRKRWSCGSILRTLILGLVSILFVLTVRTSIGATYYHYDDGTEYLVYAHGARGVKDVMEQVEEISRRTAGEKNIIVAYDVSAPDTGISWPFTWYLRDYPNTRPFDQPTKSLRDATIIIVDQKNFDKILPVVGDAYYSYDYIRMVWPNQDYFALTSERVKSSLAIPGIRQGIFNIWLNRDYTLYAQTKSEQSDNPYFNRSAYQISDWEPSDKMRLYIRKDVAAQIWDYGVGPAYTNIQADPYDTGIQAFSADISFATFGTGNGQLNNPHGIAVAPDGTIFVADTNNNRIVHFNSEGVFINAWGTYGDITLGPAPIGTLNQPWSVAVSPDGEWVYVTDTWNHRIVKYEITGQPVATWGFGQYGGMDPYGLWGPRGIALDNGGNIYITDTGNKRVIAYDSNGKYLGQTGGEGMAPGQFSEPVGLAFDPHGNLYVVDTWNQRIQAFAIITTSDEELIFSSILQWDIAGWYGQSLENKPYIAVGGQDNLYITDPELGRILEFSSTGEFIRGWGSSEMGASPIGVASGIAVDSFGHLWITDALNARVLRFTIP